MKIAFVNQPMDGVIPPHQNSIGIWTFQVARRIEQSHQIIVYAKRMRTQNQWEEEGNIQYRFIPALPNSVVSKIVGKLSRFQNVKRPIHASILYFFEYILQIALDLRKQQCDIIHIHNFSQFAPVIRAFNPKAKIVLHMNCEWLSQLDQAMIEARIKKADLILGSSDHITNKVKERFPQLANRCQTVFNGVDANYFINSGNHNGTQLSQGPKLLFVGRVSPEKGVHILIEAMPKVIEQYPEATLDIVGPIGELPVDFLIGLSDEPEVTNLASLYQESYRAYLHKLVPSQLANQINFVGAVPHSKILEYYHHADLLINPSYSESFGMSLVEAMASQKPVVATRVGGMQEVVDEGKTGLFAKRGDTKSLADAIIQLLADEKLRQSMGKAGRQRVLNLFAWEQVSKSLAGHYEDVSKGEVA